MVFHQISFPTYLLCLLSRKCWQTKETKTTQKMKFSIKDCGLFLYFGFQEIILSPAKKKFGVLFDRGCCVFEPAVFLSMFFFSHRTIETQLRILNDRSDELFNFTKWDFGSVYARSLCNTVSHKC